MSEWDTGLRMLVWITAAYLLDMLIGDPHVLYHPVRLMGRIIEMLHPIVERSRRRVLAGIWYPLVLIALSIAAVQAVKLLPSPYRELITIYILYTSLAARSLASEVWKVLRLEEIGDRRKALSMLCSRDTNALDERGIRSTLFETTAENAVDGILAPLFYILAFAPLGLSAEAALVYKSVSTCDSMVGYKNERFIEIGKVSARLDDVLNFVPARLSVICILIAGYLVQLFSGEREANASVARGIRVYRRDRYRHESPNSAHSMSLFAGILGVQIAGPMSYFGKRKEKPYLGDPIHALTDDVVRKAVYIMLLASLVELGIGAGLIVFAAAC